MSQHDDYKRQRESNQYGLTGREQQIVELMASEGLVGKDIAIRLGSTYGCIKQHQSSAYRKLGVDNAMQAILKWHGLLVGDPNPRTLPHARFRPLEMNVRAPAPGVRG